jgi:hypothetical protein
VAEESWPRQVDVTAAGRQALFLLLRATNGPGWEDPGAVYVCSANAPAGRSSRDRDVHLV